MLQRLGVFLVAVLMASAGLAPAGHADDDVSVWCGNDTVGRPAAVTAVCTLRSRTPATIDANNISIATASGSRLNYNYVSFEPKYNTSVVLFLLQQGGKSHPNDSAREISKLITFEGKRQFGFYTFAEEIEKVAPIGSDQQQISAALDVRRVRRPDTKLYTAIDAGLDDLAAVPATRRTLVLLGDGSSGRERLYEDQVVQKSQRLDIPIFTMAFTDNRSDQSIKDGLETFRRLARETGGVFEDAGPSRTISQEFLDRFYHYVENGGEAEITTSGIAAGNRLDFDLRLSNGRPITVADVPVRAGGGVVTAAVPAAVAASGGTDSGGSAGSSASSSDTGKTSDDSGETRTALADDEPSKTEEDETAADTEEEETQLAEFLDNPVAWAQDNPFPAISALVAILGLGALGLIVMLRPRAPSETFADQPYDPYGAPDIVPEPAVIQVAGAGGGFDKTVMLGGGPGHHSEDVIVPSDREVTVPESSPNLGGGDWRGEEQGYPAAPAAGSQKVYAYLEFLDSDSTRAPISATNVRIGRHRDNDICIANHSVHRQHAVIFREPDGAFLIRDLGTKNGVIVNNVRCSQTVLNDGDVIELGEVRLRYSVNR